MSTLATLPVAPAPQSGWRPEFPWVERAATSPLRRLGAFVLLAGSVRPSPFVSGIGRSVLDLPWDGGRTIFDLWYEHAATLARLTRWDRPQIQLLIDQRCPMPRCGQASSSAAAGDVEVMVRRDASELRGSGGLLHDVAEAYSDRDYLLVAHAAQVLRRPLTHAAVAAAAAGGDVGLVAHEDGSPVSVWLVRCGCLRGIAPVGFVDFLEQSLPRIAERHTVTVAMRRQSTGMPVRTHTDYLRALRSHHRGRRYPNGVAVDPFAEDCVPLFRLAEPGAQVDPRADVFDSVVLDGARVEAGATVVRSVLCPGAVVRRRQQVVDQLVNNAPPATRARAQAVARANSAWAPAWTSFRGGD